MSAVTLANGRTFNASADETILDAARRQGMVLEHSCRTGRCGVCKAPVLAGETCAIGSEEALTLAEQAQGMVLTCARAAVTEVSLGIEDLGRLAEIEVRTLPARIDSLEALAPDVLGVVLRLPPSAGFTYLPGQYIDVIAPSGARRSYSLAGAPRPDGMLELHIREVPSGELSAWWFGTAKVNDLLRFEGPFGTFYRRGKTLDPMFLVTGTGYAPARAMLQELTAQNMSGPVWLYWGGRRPTDLYDSVHFSGLDLRYVPVLSRADADWQGRRGHIQEAVLADHHDLSDTVIYACGSDAMIHSARERLQAAGLAAGNFYSDAFVASN
jgi:CDP-4-dehydro-6-deoxyglucose reductase